MRCPKCHYISFGSVDRCRNCGYELVLVDEERPMDLPIQNGNEPIGPYADLALTERTPAAPPPAPPRDDSAAMARRAAAVARFDLPLFSDGRSAVDDAPLVAPGATPRTPLSVRRGAPPVPKARTDRDEALDENRAHAGRAPAAPIERRLELAPPPAVEAVRPPVVTDTEPSALEAASIVQRLLAGLVDGVIIAAVDAGVIYSTLRLLDLTFADIKVLPPVPMGLFFVLLNGGYLAALTAAGGQTIGKMLARCRVVMALPEGVTDRHGRAPGITLGAAVLRATGYLVSLLPVGLGFLPIFLTGDGRALHDRLAGTRVVKA